MERADESLVGRNLAGRYVIEAMIGAGAMGTVYRARQIEIGKRVAIKVLRPDLTKDSSAVARFKREAKAASRLDHPSSVQMLDYGEHEGLCFLVMELLEGSNLFQIIKDEGPLAPERCADLMRQVLAALAVAHDLGIVHRDLKPENIIVRTATDDEGNTTEIVKVCDFGVAKMAPARDDQSKEGEKLTSHGVIVGTPEYMSPEQARAESLDGRSDIYAVGCILYQMMTRRVPFIAEQPVAVLLKHVIEKPVPPSTLVQGVDPRLEAVCLKAMEKAPEDRYADARAMRVALRPIAGGAAGSVDTGSQPRVLVADLADRSSTPEAATAATMELASVSMRSPPSRTLKSQLESLPPPPRRLLAQKIVFAIIAVSSVVAVAGWWKSRRDLPAVPAPPRAASPPPTSAPPIIAPPPHTSSVVVPVPSATAAPRASAPGSAVAFAPLPNFRIPPAATTETLPARSATASASASAASPPAPLPDGPGKVVFGGVRTERAAPGDVLGVLPHGRYTQCYKDGVRANPTLGGSGTLILKLENDGYVGEASFAGPEALAAVGKCVVQATVGRQVKNAQPGAGGADVDLTFKPE